MLGSRFPRRLAGRAQLGPRPLGPRLGAEALEGLEGGAQLHARIRAQTLAPQVLAVEELHVREVEGASICAESERLLEVRCRLVPLGKERAAARQAELNPRVDRLGRPRLESRKGLTGLVQAARAHRSLDHVRQCVFGDELVADVRAGSATTPKCSRASLQRPWPKSSMAST